MKKQTFSPSKVWAKILSPPCPNCGSTRTKNLERGIVLWGTFKEVVDYKTGKLKDRHSRWQCLDCHTTWDDKGNQIRRS